VDVAKHDTAALHDLEERYKTLVESHKCLRRSEERVRLATEAADIVTWEIDVATGAYIVSPNYSAVFAITEDQRPASQIAAAAIAAIVHPDDAAGLIASVQKTARGEGDLRYEYRIIQPASKEIRWAEVVGTLIRGGEAGPARVVGIIRNLTARKRNEAAIKEAADRDAYRIRLADVLRQLADPVRIQVEAMLALRLHLRVARAHFVEVEGDEAIVYVDDRRGILPVAVRQRMADFGADFVARLRRGESNITSNIQAIGLGEAELARHAAVGSRSRVSVPLMRDGQLTAVVDVFHTAPHEWTASELAVIEETAQRTWGALEHARAEAAVRESEARIREADQRKDEFLAMLAHELRNPLAPIRTGLELIRLAGDTPGAVERVRSMMQRQLAHMARLIDDLLDVSRITSGKIRLQREPTPLDSLVNSALEANRAAINAKSLALTVNLPETLCELDVDPTRFVQVLSNVLHNAAKFTESSGQIRVSAQVMGPATAGRRYVAISVKDSGIGMPAELLPRVFDLFTQGDRASSQPGLGIGLALARRLVEMHDGQIDARSEGPGRGSEFVIRVPLSEVGHEPDSVENVNAPGLDRHVLVIDDNEDAANATAMLVEELGGTSRVAYSGDEGIREALAHHPDIVLLDIHMPGLDGYDTCRRIRDALGDEVFLVALTGFGRDEDKEQAARAGFDAHLTKPAELSLLATLLTSERPIRALGEAKYPPD
jgi:PAS domain S-box-containing protein